METLIGNQATVIITILIKRQSEKIMVAD